MPPRLLPHFYYCSEYCWLFIRRGYTLKLPYPSQRGGVRVPKAFRVRGLTPVLTGPPRNTQVTLGDSNQRLRSNTLLGDNWAIICSTISVTGRMVSIFVAGIAM